MISVTNLVEAAAFSTAVVLAFAVIRRIMRAEVVPKFLDNSAAAYVIALSFTMLLSASMLGMGYVLVPLTGATYAFIITMILHFALWAVLRLIVPVRAALPIVSHVENIAPAPIVAGGAA